MKSSLAKFWPILIFTLLVLIFFKPVLLEGKLPIPADTIVGMYHPWRDFYAQDYPNGIPFKNFLITDPVRQQYVWRHLAIDQFKRGQLPLWNPYQFSGTPLLANFQSASFYPFNILFFIMPFNLAWTVLIISQPLLAGIFLYAYLRNLRLNQWASLIGALVFSFSGFSTAWLQWNTMLHAGLWLPLILLAIDKIFISYINISYKKTIWLGIFLFALISSFFAGHPQVFLYVILLVVLYLVTRLIQKGRLVKSSILPSIILFAILGILALFVTSVQWLSTLRFINLSGREFDLPNWQTSSWFLPPQNLIQFLAPDFFGNPATLNYWGEWNYGEFVGYIGILPLILSLFAVLWRRDKKVLFFSGVALISLVFALPTPLAKLPYQWHLPLISTSQPSRLLFLIDFSLSILAALGFDWFMSRLNDSNQLGKIIRVILICGLALGGLWMFSLLAQSQMKIITLENLAIARRNLVLPTILFISGAIILLGAYFMRKIKKLATIIYIIIVGITVFDLFRFGWKFTPFTEKEWLFPKTKIIEFLESQPKPFRFMATDRRIFPPNFATFYHLEDVAGYDPLYLKNYGELVAAWNRGKPDISPFSFSRILTPQDYSSRIADLLNVKYILSLKEEASPKLKLVSQEGQTRVYENKDVLPRVFFVEEIMVKNKQEVIETIFTQNFDPAKTAIVEEDYGVLSNTPLGCANCKVEILDYKENIIIIKTANETNGFLVLADPFYPSWQAEIDGIKTKIYRTDYHFRGIIVPKGNHQIKFSLMPL